MTESRKPPKGSSGEHVAVKAYREKLESIQDGVGQELSDILARAEKLRSKSDRPAKDPRRDGDDEIPIDVVELDESGFPISGTTRKKET